MGEWSRRFQQGAKCPAQGAKIQCLQSVLQGLERVSACAVSNTNELFMVRRCRRVKPQEIWKGGELTLAGDAAVGRW